MKKIITLFMLVLASLPVLADNASDARKALDKASSIITSGTGAQASFTISGNNIGKQKGKISIKGNRFCAQTPSATVWYDGKTQWTYLKANNEVNVSSASASRQQTLNPYAFVSMYKKGYKLSMQKTTTAITVRMQATGNQSIRDMYVNHWLIFQYMVLIHFGLCFRHESICNIVELVLVFIRTCNIFP